jgi:hypothetical protein
VQAEARPAEWGPPVVGQRGAHREAVAPAGGGVGRVDRFEDAFERADAAQALLELLLGVAVGRVDGLRGFAEVVELTQLVRHAGEHRPDGGLNRRLPVGDDAPDRHR